MISTCHDIGIFMETASGTQFVAIGARLSIRAEGRFHGMICPSGGSRKPKKQLDFSIDSVFFVSLSHERVQHDSRRSQHKKRTGLLLIVYE
jgi:hypothetical protein